MRWTSLADEQVKRIIDQDFEGLNYSPDNWAFLNETVQPNTYNYMDPMSTLLVNDRLSKNSKRIHVSRV
jgi:hypothetical protein